MIISRQYINAEEVIQVSLFPGIESDTVKTGIPGVEP